MKTRKTLCAGILLILMCCLLAACGKEEESESKKKKTKSTPEDTVKQVLEGFYEVEGGTVYNVILPREVEVLDLSRETFVSAFTDGHSLMNEIHEASQSVAEAEGSVKTGTETKIELVTLSDEDNDKAEQFAQKYGKALGVTVDDVAWGKAEFSVMMKPKDGEESFPFSVYRFEGFVVQVNGKWYIPFLCSQNPVRSAMVSMPGKLQEAYKVLFGEDAFEQMYEYYSKNGWATERKELQAELRRLKEEYARTLAEKNYPEGKLYITQFGKKYHLYSDCQNINATGEITTVYTVEEAEEHGCSEACATCSSRFEEEGK